jgi:hypothetical protein
MEEPEVPTEHLQEEIEHGAHHSKAGWTMGVALSSALLAGLAAVCSLLAGHHANEAMIEQIQSSDQWAFYQAKGIKSAVLESKLELLEAEGKPTAPGDRRKLAEYRQQQEEIQTLAREKQAAARKPFWWVSLVFGGVGVYFLLQGWLAGAA